ncbi:hypothetical protein NKG05_08040 [Oerskovia sp. M15]
MDPCPTPQPRPRPPRPSRGRHPRGPSPQARTHAEDLARFVEASPSSFHAAHEVARRAVEAGFTLLDESDAWPRATAEGRYVVVRDGAVIAWATPDGAGATTLSRSSARTPTPRLQAQAPAHHRARGLVAGRRRGVRRALLNSWLDRELELAGGS